MSHCFKPHLNCAAFRDERGERFVYSIFRVFLERYNLLVFQPDLEIQEQILQSAERRTKTTIAISVMALMIEKAFQFNGLF